MKKSKALEKHIGYWLRLVSNHVSASFARKLAEHDVGVGEWVVMNLLAEQKVMAPADIAELTGLTRGATSKLLDRLYRKKLVLRAESLEDRRRQEIVLSETGTKLLPQLIKLANQNDERFFGHLSKVEKETLSAILKQITFIRSLDDVPID